MSNSELIYGFGIIGKDIIEIIMDYHKDLRKIVIRKRRKRRMINLNKTKKIFVCNLI